MAGTYTTRQGDAWDAIAHQVYGSVKYTGWLMEHNHQHLDTFRFPAGVVLQTPDPPPDSAADNLPIWRTEA
jgi:phage tail protein X